MKKIIPLFALSIIVLSLSAKVWIVTAPNSPLKFTPDSLTISVGDSVLFQLASNHDAREVAQTTWSSNGNTSSGGFQTSFGGGLILPPELTVGAHYYVCTPHAVAGMKGRIFVTSTTGIQSPFLETNLFKTFPNPANNKLNILIFTRSGSKLEIDLFDISGKKVYSMGQLSELNGEVTIVMQLDRNILQSGIYFIEVFEDGRRFSGQKIVLE